jgi:NAD+ synthase
MFDKDVLRLDPSAEVNRITETLREQVLGQLRRRGAVVGISGGIDSSVVAALCARACGRNGAPWHADHRDVLPRPDVG